MAIELSSEHVRFSLDPASGRFDVLDARGRGIAGARLDVRYERVTGRTSWTGAFDPAAVERRDVADPKHGPMSTARAVSREDGVEVALEIALPRSRPLALWRVLLRNLGRAPIRVGELDLLSAGDGSVRLGGGPSEPAFFVNGWQSWSDSRAYRLGQKQWHTRLGPISAPVSKGPGWSDPRAARGYLSEMFGVRADLRGRTGVLVGFLSQRWQLGSVLLSPGLRLWAHGDGALVEPGEAMETDWAAFQLVDLDSPEPLSEYLDAAARESGARASASLPVGWCSWYHYFNRVTEADLLSNLRAVADARPALPLELFQLDDGFQAQVGDWLERNEKFPSDLARTAEKIRRAGLRPGLWLAPFSAHPKSKLVREHPDWLLRGEDGEPANAGFVFETFCHALDVTHPEVKAYVAEVIRAAAKAWRFSFLKLDFLYMGALAGRRYDPHLTRAQAIRSALEVVRDAAGPDTFLLGCGCPLGSGIGIFDGMRISSDVAPSWQPRRRFLNWLVRAERDVPCARNSTHNTLVRAPLHRRWWVNDPDCLLARDHDTELTEEEVRTLATAIALSGGALLVSDDFARLSAPRRELLARLLPPLDRAARALDAFDSPTPSKLVLHAPSPAGEAWLVALFNWDDSPRTLRVDLAQLGPAPGGWHAIDFWRQRPLPVTGPELSVEAVPAHGCVLARVTPVVPGEPQWLGSDLHFSQGAELESFESSAGRVRLVLSLGREAKGFVWLALPVSPHAKASCGGTEVSCERVGEGIYRAGPLTIPRRVELELIL